MDDRQIIQLFFARSEQAIQTLTAKYGKLCRTIARGILADPRDAEECENDTWLRVWNSIPPDCLEYLGAYVGRITRNLALNRLKFDRRKSGAASWSPSMLNYTAASPTLTTWKPPTTTPCCSVSAVFWKGKAPGTAPCSCGATSIWNPYRSWPPPLV